MLPQTLFWFSSLCLVLSVASALVARAAARQARADLRELMLNQDRLDAEIIGLAVRQKRLEGRQTARIGRDGPKATDNGLPDPQQNPEAWRAAVRRMAIQSPKPSGELQ